MDVHIGAICFDYVTSLLDAAGESIGGHMSYVGPQTDKVINIMFKNKLVDQALYPILWINHQGSYEAEFLVYDYSYIGKGSNGRSEERFQFTDNKEVFKITKKIQHALFKTELERLMYPLPKLVMDLNRKS